MAKPLKTAAETKKAGQDSARRAGMARIEKAKRAAA
jgi:hypothetical protein